MVVIPLADRTQREPRLLALGVVGISVVVQRSMFNLGQWLVNVLDLQIRIVQIFVSARYQQPSWPICLRLYVDLTFVVCTHMPALISKMASPADSFATTAKAGAKSRDRNEPGQTPLISFILAIEKERRTGTPFRDLREEAQANITSRRSPLENGLGCFACSRVC